MRSVFYSQPVEPLCCHCRKWPARTGVILYTALVNLLNDPESCYQALCARDSRFDGRIFVGVTTTGIYCRPVCPARTPASQRCKFFASAAAAEQGGYRPCLRCRPELAPGQAPVDSEQRLLQRALSLIWEGQEEPLSQRLQIGERQLRQVFQERLGVSPHQMVLTQRLALARQLLHQTTLPISEIAFTAGFSSLRRFQSLWKEQMGQPPSRIRPLAQTPPSHITLELAFRPPYDWGSWLEFMAYRAIPQVEDIHQGVYSRTLRLGGHSGWIRARPKSTKIAVDISHSLLPVLGDLLTRLRHLLDLDAEPQAIAARLGDLYWPGLRVPGCLDDFELAVRAVLGQQVSVKAARTLAARLVERAGEPIETPYPQLSRLFPDATALATTQLGDGLGVTGARQKTLQALCLAYLNGLSLSPSQDWESSEKQLLALPGIGPWTVQYLAMRALRNPNAFPHSDLVLCKRQNLQPKELLKRSLAWSPWRAYAALSIWKGDPSCNNIAIQVP